MLLWNNSTSTSRPLTSPPLPSSKSEEVKLSGSVTRNVNCDALFCSHIYYYLRYKILPQKPSLLLERRTKLPPCEWSQTLLPLPWYEWVISLPVNQSVLLRMYHLIFSTAAEQQPNVTGPPSSCHSVLSTFLRSCSVKIFSIFVWFD